MSKSIRKLLVANRGEIALRIMRTAKELEIQTVAVYSDFDKTAPHVKFADEAIHVGASAVRDSYLNIKRIIQAARKTECDAIHPGYGLLSENVEFAEAVIEAGLIFIGPRPHAIRVMGDKLASKNTVKDYAVPLIPGLDTAITDVEEAKKAAVSIGFPILVKASAGGGGKGMRIVRNPAEFEEEMNGAISEATSAFGDGRVFIEKYLEGPKHIEFQILRDAHGNGVHLFERECSIQRRYQKVIEEAPSITLDEELRERMGNAALKVAESCDYLGAGTVEFIVDKHRNFYFLEMNTRLQVEHPVTEMISGLDLVKEQIFIAEGKKLRYTQADLHISGHAVEMRVYAENPLNNFLPDTGVLTTYKVPGGPGIRVDDGVEEGSEISIYYDPMLAKLVAYGVDRTMAIKRLMRAIDEYQIEGVSTSLPFGTFVLSHKDFLDGTFTTAFVGEYWKEDAIIRYKEEEEFVAALLAADHFVNQLEVPLTGEQRSNWKTNRKD